MSGTQWLLSVKNGKVTHVQNGVKVCEYELWTPAWDKMVANSKFKDFPGFYAGNFKRGLYWSPGSWVSCLVQEYQDQGILAFRKKQRKSLKGYFITLVSERDVSSVGSERLLDRQEVDRFDSVTPHNEYQRVKQILTLFYFTRLQYGCNILNNI